MWQKITFMFHCQYELKTDQLIVQWRPWTSHYKDDDDRYSGPDKTDRGYTTDQSDDNGEAHNNNNRGRAANFYINGDVFFTAKRVVYNPKHFKDLSHYLDYLTDRMAPRFGAVRKIHTPKHGHKVDNLKDLKENASYVVAGNERFKSFP
ncbi:Doublecortin domain-containing protein 2, partial [Bulinus truncatus]